jgi:hypothetical protein
MENQLPDSKLPWLDHRLTKKAMNHLWNSINHPIQDIRGMLAGNISKSESIPDSDNWFFKNVLLRCIETLYYNDWNNYYHVHVIKDIPPPEFTLNELWVNYQKQYEFNPMHDHGGLYSFVVFMKIPTHWKEQHALPISANSNRPSASNFEFILPSGPGGCVSHSIPLSPKDEGRILFFPSWLCHQVLPFYECKEDRITISGNISDFSHSQLDALEKEIEMTNERIDYMKKRKVEMIEGTSITPIL